MEEFSANGNGDRELLIGEKTRMENILGKCEKYKCAGLSMDEIENTIRKIDVMLDKIDNNTS